jgi:hypothetical protein
MRRKRLKRQSIGLFDVPDRHDEDDETAVLGGPTADSGLFGGSSHGSGLFDAPDRTAGEMPGLFDRPRRPGAEGPGLFDRPPPAARAGLFDKPAPRRK